MDTYVGAYPEEMKREFYANKSATGKLVRMYEVKQSESRRTLFTNRVFFIGFLLVAKFFGKNGLKILCIQILLLNLQQLFRIFFSLQDVIPQNRESETASAELIAVYSETNKAA